MKRPFLQGKSVKKPPTVFEWSVLYFLYCCYKILALVQKCLHHWTVFFLKDWPLSNCIASHENFCPLMKVANPGRQGGMHPKLWKSWSILNHCISRGNCQWRLWKVRYLHMTDWNTIPRFCVMRAREQVSLT